jgi:twitching motility protein PilT
MDGEAPVKIADEFAISDLHDILEILLREYGRHQDTGEFAIEYDNVIYRVAVIDDIQETWFSLRKPMTDIPRIAQLGGFTTPMVRHLAWLGKKSGLILIAGKTGNGKTTTAYTLLREYLKAYNDIAVTIEDPPEMRFKAGDFKASRCYQLRLSPGESFAQRLVKALRMNPKYIFIGELRRGLDAMEALRYAASGHVIITTIHAGSVIEAVNRFTNLASSEGVSETFVRDMFATSIAAIIHQEIQTVRSVKAGGGFKRKLNLETLFFGPTDTDARSLIRLGQTSKLNTIIDKQARLMENDEPPTPLVAATTGRTGDGRKGR